MRVGIVNDLPIAREALKRVVQSRAGYQVAWLAEDGEAAVRLARGDCPDVILMDLVMPGIGGVEATRQIMAVSPCPILVVTATVAGNYELVLRAMSHGALNAVQTPQLGLDGRLLGGQELLARLEQVERMKAPGGLRVAGAEALRSPGVAPHRGVEGSAPATVPPLVALGASTGGPEALAQVLAGLTANFPAAVVVIQHIEVAFAPGLVAWLRGRCVLPVERAQEGELPRPGAVAVAATNDHLMVASGGRFHYTAEPVEEPFRPSVNVFFESLLRYWPRPGVAVLLTGMRDDGAAGMAALRRAGWLTIAQDEATSVVYGMPRAAAEQNAASRVLPLPQIAGAIVAGLPSPASGKAW
jgi:two-component system response regulator WspF